MDVLKKSKFYGNAVLAMFIIVMLAYNVDSDFQSHLVLKVMCPFPIIRIGDESGFFI